MNIAKYLNLPEHIVEIYGQIPRCSILIKDETFIKIYESIESIPLNVIPLSITFMNSYQHARNIFYKN